MIKPVIGRITTDFYEMRPLSVPMELRDHVHGAIDIAAKTGSIISAPETGELFGYIAFRNEPGQYWSTLPIVHGVPFSWGNYFYDMYGGILVLESEQNTHIFGHSWGNQIINHYFDNKHIHYVEQIEEVRFPIHAIWTDKVSVSEGDIIGYVGNAGYSTGPHVHWEIHPSKNRWIEHAYRLNPEKLI